MRKGFKKKNIKNRSGKYLCFCCRDNYGRVSRRCATNYKLLEKNRELCNKFDIHLICDEIWCGAGTTGKNFSIDWDNVTPDFVTFGKTLTSGYVPLSVIITKRNYLNKIKDKFGSILLPSSTFQGHSLGVAAALGAQKIVNNLEFLSNVSKRNIFEILLKTT